MMKTIHWQPTCCAWHGEYAEVPMTGGGMMRLKRDVNAPDEVLAMRFGADHKPLDVDAEGAPVYVARTEAEVLALLA